jgi:hypothetical protein
VGATEEVLMINPFANRKKKLQIRPIQDPIFHWRYACLPYKMPTLLLQPMQPSPEAQSKPPFQSADPTKLTYRFSPTEGISYYFTEAQRHTLRQSPYGAPSERFFVQEPYYTETREGEDDEDGRWYQDYICFETSPRYGWRLQDQQDICYFHETSPLPVPRQSYRPASEMTADLARFRCVIRSVQAKRLHELTIEDASHFGIQGGMVGLSLQFAYTFHDDGSVDQVCPTWQEAIQRRLMLLYPSIPISKDLWVWAVSIEREKQCQSQSHSSSPLLPRSKNG